MWNHFDWGEAGRRTAAVILVVGIVGGVIVLGGAPVMAAGALAGA